MFTLNEGPYFTKMQMKTSGLDHGLSVLKLSTLMTGICVVESHQWKAQAGNVCVSSFDRRCSGICNSVEKIKYVHSRCGEGDEALWSAAF
ncbi:hypothetical protein RJ641_031983 [Dillenia turbinata]|uniref:Uncharacterized protein n=1 Tax=Dillenia turbinata TaxID=194707 RepID=A0AAN8ZLI8_9MAGN